MTSGSDHEPFVRVLHPDALKNLTDTPTWERGERYVREGRVQGLRRQDGTVRATVHGSEPYEVTIYVRKDRLAYQCPCPSAEKGFFCKHCVAVAISWLAETQGALPAPTRSPEPATALALAPPPVAKSPSEPPPPKQERLTDKREREYRVASEPSPWRPGRAHAFLRELSPTDLADLLLDLAETYPHVRSAILERMERPDPSP